jgi:hypothetical protein
MQPDGENFEGTMILECPKCHLKWMERTQLPMSIEAFIARAKGFNVCPVCGNSKGTMMMLGEKFKEAYAEMTKLGVNRL